MAWKPQYRQKEFCDRSKKYRTKYFDCLKQLFTDLESDKTREVEHEKSKEGRTLQVEGSVPKRRL